MRKRAISLLAGAGAGLLGGVMGVGGAPILVPVMVGYLGLDQHKAHGTSLAIVLFLALFGAMQYYREGYIDWVLFAELALASSLGVIIGAKVMARVPALPLQRAFGVFLLLVALSLLLI